MNNLRQWEILATPFSPEQHEIKKVGGMTRAYVKEYAITERLRLADPSFSIRVVSVWVKDTMVNVHLSLTAMGATREGIGSQLINAKAKKRFEYDEVEDGKDDWGKPKFKSIINREKVFDVVLVDDNEAEKSAATDAYKRAARMFGIGHYLTEIDKESPANTPEELKKHISKMYGNDIGLAERPFSAYEVTPDCTIKFVQASGKPLEAKRWTMEMLNEAQLPNSVGTHEISATAYVRINKLQQIEVLALR